MVLNRNDKRKRKEGDLVDLMDPVSESPKRTKVHAQRKFAQGAPTNYSPASTPVKEKEKSKPPVITELITHKRPNTEDFLTFLCFRGTSILPPSLNFFNISTKKEKSETKSTKASRPTPSTSKATSSESGKSNSPQKSTKSKSNAPLKKEFPKGIQKTIKFKTKTSTAQALKKKYLEQRLAKQRIKNNVKAAYVIRTRSSTEQNAGKPLPKLASRNLVPKSECKRRGLRSGGLVEKSVAPKTAAKIKRSPMKPKKRVLAKSKSNSSNSESSDDEELKSSQGKKVTKSLPKKVCTRNKSDLRRVTRSSVDTKSPQHLSRRPTRKTKEAAAVYMEILGRKLVSPELENDEDNISLDSFPELPNARRSLKEEIEIKAKVKQNAKFVAKEKESKGSSVSSKKVEKIEKIEKVEKIEKLRAVKTVLKSKRLVKIHKYCELESEDESESSTDSEKSSEARPITRRSLNKVIKPANRSLRSSTRNIPVKVDVQSAEVKKEVRKEKIVVKRKREVLEKKKEEGKEESKKDEEKNEARVKEESKKAEGVQKDSKKEDLKSDSKKEETTKTDIKKGESVNEVSKKDDTKIDDTKKDDTKKEEVKRIKKEEMKREEVKKTVKKEESRTESKSDTKSETKSVTKTLNKKDTKTESPDDVENVESDEETLGSLLIKMKKKKEADSLKKTEQTKSKVIKEVKDPKISDDEEAFRGFTKKAISSVLDSCQSHVNANLLISEAEIKSSVEPPSPERLESPPEVKDDTLIIEQPSIIPVLKPAPEIKIVTPKADSSKQDKTHVYKSEAEVNIIDMPSSATLGRKERVNMSTEQIEKWLCESSLAKEESKVEMENVTNFQYETVEKPKVSTHHLSISSKIQHLVRPVNVTLAKLNDKKGKPSNLVVLSPQVSAIKHPGSLLAVKNKPVEVEPKQPILVSKPQPPKVSKESPNAEDSDAVSKSDQNSLDGSPDKKNLEKKILSQPRKLFLPKVKERKIAAPSANAFSPENESSVYAFESDTEVPVSTPFRRKSKPASPLIKGPDEKSSKDNPNKDSNDTQSSELSGGENFKVPEAKKETETPIISTKTNTIDLKNLANMQVLSLDKLTTNWSNVNCSASIAVQVNLDEQNQVQNSEVDENGQLKSTEISTQTEGSNDNDDDNDGQLFYIPLQAVTRNGSVQGHQLIQGVAVKLGTEGPTGPNQRVLLKAKLVTKPPLNVARVPPVGTVQPTARAPPIASTSSADHPMPSTSSAVPVASTSEIRGVVVHKEENLNQGGNVRSKETATSSGGVEKAEKVLKSQKASRERKVSIDSGKPTKRSQGKSKQKILEICSPTNATTFPGTKDPNEEARLVEAPTFHPTEKDFQDPLEYIDKIRPIAEKFGICRVVPPGNFKPECKVSDDMRFTAYNQYVHRMLHRWGPNVKEMMAIRKYLATQSITLNHPPWIGGMEIDLPHLYQTVQSLGGLKEVIEKKKWQKVSDGMKIPRSAQDRVTKLDDIYCKYLLPYDTLSQAERDKLFEEVESEWKTREAKALRRLEAQSNDNEEEEDEDSSDEIEECIVKGRNMPLNAFYRIARNTQRMWFSENQRSGNEAEGASASEVEAAFWKHVAEKKRHVCVHAASIDSSGRGFGFSVAKNSPCARHPWNLKVLTNNAGSVLRAMGPLMGVTVPTLHVGMLFSACCWYRDPHGLPWIEYLHTGAKKIWYGIPDEHSNNFRNALSKMVPRYCKNKKIWLPSDTAMVPPEMLVKNDVPLCQTVQEPGQFIVVFPKAFTSSICTGYVVSESVYFAQSSWLETAEQVFQDIHDSCEPSIFSFERLLFSLINDTRSHVEILKQILPTVKRVCEREIDYRRQLKSLGLTNTEKLPTPESGKRGKGKKIKEEDGDFECETCRASLFVSLVSNSLDDGMYCLPHGIQLLTRKKHLLKNCLLMITYSESDLDDLIHKLEDRIEAKSKKSNSYRQNK
ncbi:protein Jumonji [Belonocnema kinseyi]|uniref:protein Jumonji n=1 Tax=Belonocnema kinseyi TaxID=2817044 RepID=UPI00143CC47A|nr:protein Jumonji [Belonocnema kinseyi]